MSLIKTIFFFFLPFTVLAQSEYTFEDVSEHSTTEDCWMVFEDKVYDFSEYLPDHDKFMDIREWCGMDMTEDFKTKADAGRDHKPFTYGLLDEYYIGDIVAEEESTEDIVETVVVEERNQNPYNLLPILIGTLVLYWGSYFIFKKKYLKRFKAFWNTVLLLTFLIPSLGFGIYLILSYSFPKLREINFDFLYWHVDLSVVMGAIALSHFIQRFKQYLVQLRK